MANEKQATPQVAIPLPKGKRTAVNIGGICLMLFIAFSGLSLALIQAPVLEQMGAMEYFSTLTIFASLGLAIMTPIGGKLGDMFGRRNVIMISGIAAVFCCVGLGIATSMKNIVLFMAFRLLLGAAQGAFTAAPYILVREVNEVSETPKLMGLLTSAITVGGFAGSILAGIMVDAGQILLAVVFPVIPLVIGLALIWFNLPNKASAVKQVIDWAGIVGLAVFLTALLMSLNYGPKLGFGNPIILGGLAVSVVAGFIFAKIENRAASPVVPMRLLRNKRFVTLLLVGWVGFYYQVAMNSYCPLAMLNIMGASATLTGSLMLPRTIFSMILPVALGTWVAKKSDRPWKAIAISMSMYMICFLPMAFTTAATPPVLYIALIALTGIGDSFKAVAITPSAQATLDPADIGIGTALINFFNSTATLVSGAVDGILLDMNGENLQVGVNMIFGSTAAVALVALLITVFVIRNQMKTA